jgi:hypothetical protein
MVAIDPKQKRRILAVAVAAVAAAAALSWFLPLLCASTRGTVARMYRRRLAKNWRARERKAKRILICVFPKRLKPCVARLLFFLWKVKKSPTERGCPILFMEGKIAATALRTFGRGN